MSKHIIVYLVGALTILVCLYNWHRTELEVNALKVELADMTTIVKEKADESKREQQATLERDEQYEKQDKVLTEIQRSLRKIQKDNADIKARLATVVPPESMRGLRSYKGYKHEATSP